MWQFYVLPWVFCELPGPHLQSRKFKFKIHWCFPVYSQIFKELCVISSRQILAFQTTKTQHALVLEFQWFFWTKSTFHDQDTKLNTFYQHIYYMLRIYLKYHAGIFMNPEFLKVNIEFHFTLFEIWDCLNEIPPLFWYFPSFSAFPSIDSIRAPATFLYWKPRYIHRNSWM